VESELNHLRDLLNAGRADGRCHPSLANELEDGLLMLMGAIAREMAGATGTMATQSRAIDQATKRARPSSN
jgi:hypothetical protein